MEVTGPRIYQAIAVKQGLKACKIGMRLNTAYTPKNLFHTAKQFTGKIYKRGQYDEAIADMEDWIKEAHNIEDRA